MLITESKLRSLIRRNIVRTMLTESSMKNSKDLQRFCQNAGIDIEEMYRFYPHADEFWTSPTGRTIINGRQGEFDLKIFLEKELKNQNSSTDISDLWDSKTGKWTSMGQRTVKEMIYGKLEQENTDVNERTQIRIIKEEQLKALQEFLENQMQEEEDITNFVINLIAILENCSDKYPKVWNTSKISNDTTEIRKFFDVENDEIGNVADLTDKFDQFIDSLRNGSIKFNRNYPAEIFFNNIVSRETYFKYLMLEDRAQFNPDEATKRIWKTLMYRHNQKKTQKVSKQSGESGKLFNDDSKILQRAGKETGDFAMPEKLKNW